MGRSPKAKEGGATYYINESKHEKRFVNLWDSVSFNEFLNIYPCVLFIVFLINSLFRYTQLCPILFIYFHNPLQTLNRLNICLKIKGTFFGLKFEISKVKEGYLYFQVKCEQKIYHPNIDLEGNVCLNILREDWKPVLTINSVVYGLQYLFLEPNPDDPLNKVGIFDCSTVTP